MDISGDNGPPRFVMIGEAAVGVGRSGNCALQLLHPSVSRSHATLARTGNELLVTDCDSRFGTFVNGHQIRNVRARLGDRLRFGTAIVYRVETDGLRLEVAAGGVSLSATGLDLVKNDKLLVQDAGFKIEASSFVGILGPSGSGKSTLLNCLAGFLAPIRGRLTFDESHDASAENDAYRSLLAYVTQDDVVCGALTVGENLQFAARLQLGSLDRESISSAVQRALDEVGLAEHAAKRAKDVSGGQRKRLSVAIELMKRPRPRLLLLDEPTSGLDPASEAHLIEQLRLLASQGATVVCTTHLMDNVRLFDTIIVLGLVDGVGRIAFVGKPDQLLPHFGCRGFADLYELLESGRFRPIQGPADAGHDSDGGAMPTARAANERVSGPIGAVTGDQVVPPRRPATVGQLFAQVMASTGWRQFWLLTWRSLILLCRDRGLVATMLIQPLGLGLLVSLTQYSPARITPILFFAIAISIWLGMNNSIRDLVRERKHYVRERLAGLRPDAYFASKWAVYTIAGLLQLLLLWLVIRRCLGWTVNEGFAADALASTSSVWVMVILLLSYTGGLGLGLLVSVVMKSEEAAVAVLPLLIMPQLLLSVATGQAGVSYSQPRPFRPLVVMLHEPWPGGAAACVDLLSLAVLSRPATLAAECPSVTPGIDGFAKGIWIADLCHLCLLLLGTWAIAYFAFRRAERSWPRLIGLG